jgi:DNA-binding XRE family transcriptional regulator
MKATWFSVLSPAPIQLPAKPRLAKRHKVVRKKWAPRRLTQYTLPHRLNALRTAAGYSYAELARATGIDAKSLRRFEIGESEPRFDTVVRLARFFRVTTDSFAE